MKTFLPILCVFFTVRLLGQDIDTPPIEIVESIPIETNLDNPDIRNTIEVWLQMIKGAKRSLDVEQFYVSRQHGEPLDTILTAIVAAGERGVRVRFVVDARMYRTYPETVDWLGKQKNISIRIIDFGKLTGGIQHAKFFIVDGGEIFIGSQNLDWRALKHIHEVGIRIRKMEAVTIYQDIFDLDWTLAERNDPIDITKHLIRKSYSDAPVEIRKDGASVKLLPTMSPKALIPDTMLWDEQRIVDLIDGAKSEVFCQFLTYSPVGRDNGYYAALDNALRRAAVRGVHVQMIVSDWSLDHPAIEHLKSLVCIPNIQIKYSAIPEWSGGYIPYARVEHCKFIVVDSASFWLGTSNAEKSYFYTSRNLGVVVNNTGLTGMMRNIFLKSWDGPYTTLIEPGLKYEARRHGER